jgi:hypothetical protein
MAIEQTDVPAATTLTERPSDAASVQVGDRPASAAELAGTQGLSDALRELIGARGVPVVASYCNLDQVVVITNEERARAALESVARTARGRRGWRAPAALLLTLVVALATGTFSQRRLFLAGNGWQLIFVLAAAGSLLWLTVELVRSLRSNGAEDPVELGMKELMGRSK